VKRALVAATAALVAAAAALAPAGPAQAAVGVIVHDLRPAFGEVVPAGATAVAADLVGGAAITDSHVKLDGIEVPSSRTGSTAVATVDLTPGEHVLQVDAAAADGGTGSRAWRVSASALAVRRLAGADRIATAAAVSQDLYPTAGTATGAVLARADTFADALAGAALAAHANGPVLLTDHDHLSAAAEAELRRAVLPGSVVYLLGGTDALADAVAAQVTNDGYLSRRIAGADRAATAAAAGDQLDAPTTAIVANGSSFADAVGASSPSAAKQLPVLLVNRDAVPGATTDFVRRHALTRLYLVGGTAAVSDATASQLAGLVGGNLTRISGPDRYATAMAVAQQFFGAGAPVGIASGTSFPDALAGGRRAAAAGGPLVLVSPAGGPADPDAFAALQPRDVTAFGGAAALSDAAVAGTRRAVYDAGAPRVVGIDPFPGTGVDTIGTITLDFDRALNTGASNVYVTMDGQELPGIVSAGDFASTLVFTPGTLPFNPQVGQTVDVRVVVAAYDGSTWRHLDHHLTYRKLDLSPGDSGPAVTQLQQRLVELGYWLPGVDGSFGSLTLQAVYAFQKAHGLPRDGVVGAATRAALQSDARPTARTTTGHVVEVDKTRQVLLLVTNGHVDWTFNTSTGTDKPFTELGTTRIAHTPEGSFSVIRQIDGIDDAPLGVLYRPKFFTSTGVAVHGSSSIPPYPASHGCVRVSNAAMDWLWGTNAMPLGTRVVVYS
jgi:N-acetylmuramoyl-L-alanine amidase